MSPTYYLHEGTVARIVREGDAVSVELFDRERQSFVSAPGLYGRLLGLGGDPPAEQITAEEAARLMRLDADPA